MIDPGEVIDAVLTVLVGVHALTDLDAPAGNPDVYGVLDPGAGPPHDEGDQGDRDRHLVAHFRLRTVVRHADRAAAKRMAVDLSHRYEVALQAATIETAGDGWSVNYLRCVATSGTLPEGDIVNIVDDYELRAVPKP